MSLIHAHGLLLAMFGVVGKGFIMLIKMMKNEDLKDGNAAKSFKLVAVKPGSVIDFYRVQDDLPEIRIDEPDGGVMIFRPEGNTYVLEDGVTSAAFMYRL